MSRHRNIRSMNYSEEYEGFDDVYGHSVEDDHCISPSEARFLYDRTRYPQMSAFINEDNYIAEEDEPSSVTKQQSKNIERPNQNLIDEEKLRMCIEDIQNVIGDMVSQSVIEEIVLKFNYNIQQSLDFILNENEIDNEFQSLPEKSKKNKNKDEDNKGAYVSKTNSSSALFSGGGDGPENPVTKFVIPKLKNSQVSRLEQGMNDLKLIDENTLSNFSSLQALMEQHKKFALVQDDDESKLYRESPSSDSCPSTLAEFSKTYLKNKNTSIDVPSLSTDESRPSFIIPKLKPKGIENDSTWLIDLSLALRTETEPTNSPDDFLSSTSDLHTSAPPCVSEDIFFNSNFDNISNILNHNMELNNENSSPFGKIMCKKWKYNSMNLIKRESTLPSRVVHFDFSTPSPDDLTLKYVRRK